MEPLTIGNLTLTPTAGYLQGFFARILGWYVVTDSIYGATGDGLTDDTAAVQAAIDAAHNAGGGIVYFARGTFLCSSLTVYSNITLVGARAGVSIIKQKAGANSDLIVSTGFAGLTGGGTAGGVSHVTLRDLEIDGNVSGQTIAPTTVATTTVLPAATIPLASTSGFSSGGGIANIMTTSGMQVVTYTGVSGSNLTGCTGGSGTATAGYPAYSSGRGVALYGYFFNIERCWIHSCVADGLWTEWSLSAAVKPQGGSEAFFVGNKYTSNGVIGHTFIGPHDAIFRDCVSHTNTFAGWVFNATVNASGCHGWGYPQRYSYFIATGNCTFQGCIAEITNTAKTRGIYIGGVSGTVWYGGEVFVPTSSPDSGAIGIEIVGASDTDIDTNFENCVNGAVYMNSDGGNNRIRGLVKQALGPAVTHLATLVTAGSNGVDVATFLGAGVLNVATTTNFLTGSVRYLAVATSAGGAILTYTGVTATTFTGVTLVSGSGTLSTNGTVSQGVNYNGSIGSDLTTVAASTMIELAVAGGTTAPNVENSRGYTKRTGSFTPSATINTYGGTTSLRPAAQAGRSSDYGLKLEHLAFTATGIAGGETLTIEILSNTIGQNQTSITITLTAASPTYTVTTLDIYNLVQTGTPLYFQLHVKSSAGSSAASVDYTMLGWS